MSGNGKFETDDGVYGHQEDIGNNNHSDMLKRIRTAGAVSITPELFEKLYLQPKNEVSGMLRGTFGNPTPIGIIGFLMCLTPLSCSLMGWRGASNTGFAFIPDYWFFGGLLMVLSGFLEWVLGNTFSSIVFLSFGAFWLTFAGTLTPGFAAFSSFAAEGQAAATGFQTTAFNASWGFFLVTMGIMCLVFLVCSIRTNVCFMIIFFCLVIQFGLLTGAYWYLAEDYVGNAAAAGRLVVAGGAFAFITSLTGWWIFFAQLLASVDFPLELPVGDLSTIVKGRSDRLKARKGQV